jgi:hypothetical protein
LRDGVGVIGYIADFEFLLRRWFRALPLGFKFALAIASDANSSR